MTPTSPGIREEVQLVVLVVDDSARNRKLACDVLRAAGLQTLAAATGGEAVALAATYLPDVILMDLRLPDMDGADAARVLADSPRTGRIPVLAMSSLPRVDDWFLAGFADYIEKPFDVRDLPERVRRAARAASH